MSEIESLRGLVSGFLNLDADRAERRYGPFFTLKPGERPYLREFIPTSPPSDVELTDDNLRDAQDKTLAFCLEVATQITEYRPKRQGVVREDTDSLQKMYQLLRRGEGLQEKLKAERPADVQNVIAKFLTTSKRVQPDRVNPEVISRSSMAINQAKVRIARNIELFRGYLGR